jgi:hypothetical protein
MVVGRALRDRRASVGLLEKSMVCVGPAEGRGGAGGRGSTGRLSQAVAVAMVLRGLRAASSLGRSERRVVGEETVRRGDVPLSSAREKRAGRTATPRWPSKTETRIGSPRVTEPMGAKVSPLLFSGP